MKVWDSDWKLPFEAANRFNDDLAGLDSGLGSQQQHMRLLPSVQMWAKCAGKLLRN